MESASKGLPSFDQPPVVEVVLSVQFEPLMGFHVPHFGLVWNQVKDRFPVIEEHPPLDPTFERFGIPKKTPQPGVQLQLMHEVPFPRCWFVNEAGTELLQVQRDRFIHNWRKKGKEEEEYPRYEKLRATFWDEIEGFQELLEREQLGSLSPNQCEITYVNHIILGQHEDGPQEHGDITRMLTILNRDSRNPVLANPEDMVMRFRYIISDADSNPIGRLHTSLNPAYRTDDGLPLYVATLTARGEPRTPDTEGVMAFFDVGRERVVETFAAFTSDEMHRLWRRADDR